MSNKLLLFLIFFTAGSAIAQTPVIFDGIGFGDYHTPFVKVRKDSKIYFCHPVTGVLVDDVKDHSGDLLSVVKDGAYAVIHENGKFLSNFNYDEVALLTHYDGQWYPGIRYNYQFVQTKKKGKYGLIDFQGKVISEPRFQALEIINKDIIGFKENNKWGWLRATDGEVIQPPLYDEVGKNYLFEDMVQIHLNGKQGIADKSGKVVIPPTYESLSNIWLKTKKYKAFLQNNAYGLIDSLGTIVLPATYKSLIPVRGSDFLKIEERGLQGLIDATGKEATPPLYNEINDFVRGHAIVKKAGRMGLIDERGELLLSPQYDEIEFKNSAGQTVYDGVRISLMSPPVSNASKEHLERLAAEAKLDAMPYYLRVKDKGKVGIFDWGKAKPILPPDFTDITIVNQKGETYLYAANGNLYGIYDKLGKEILPPKYRLQSDSYTNRSYTYGDLNDNPYIFPVYDDKRVGIYNSLKKQFIVPVSDVEITWLNARTFEIKRKVEGTSYNEESAIYNTNGEVLIPYTKDMYILKMLNDKLLLAEEGSQFVIFNMKGEKVFERPEWNRIGYYSAFKIPENRKEDAKPFQSGLFKINIKEENLFIDENGKQVQFKDFAYVGKFYDNLAWAITKTGDDTLYGLIDTRGNVVVEPQFDRLEAINDHPDLMLVKKKGKYGVLNLQGKMILEPIYDMINSFSPELMEITLKGRSGLADNDGKIVLEPRFDNLRRNYEGENRTWPILAQEGNEFSFINKGINRPMIVGKSKID
ncbi:WG repeat-containing protein [Chryseobacterium balustinum]|uniref:WG containing repeat-containing protein n=2 Tax=Chryseobacterium balustinum TaxID=246 RepID=A0ABY1LEP0_9FLAO|nr:WG repeat-containing protein [Chryseobacterium balustinum]AZB29320.1 WG repeat-containing protein [Chryseobacterium balustinum]SKC11077.1 WG containing repeat-containing protein [Chryseobacterium balustinum]